MLKVPFLVWWLVGSLAGSTLPLYAANYGYDLKGRPVSSLAGPQAQAVVLFFLATDCPISNRYAPEIKRLEEKFKDRNIVFWLVYPNATETDAGVREHLSDYGLKGRVLLHPDASFLATSRVTVTPESVVLARLASNQPRNAALTTTYSGRIDDRYLDIGRQRPQATRHDLEEAVNAVVSRQPVTAPGGPPVGCGIIRATTIQGGRE